VSYQKAENILPREVLELIQNYIDGEYLYIPRKIEKKKTWGETTKIKQELSKRNVEIYKEYSAGMSIHALADLFFLSSKSIQRIVLAEKKRNSKT
jgi:DNA-binding NarL/FixJ family response regulator